MKGTQSLEYLFVGRSLLIDSDIRTLPSADGLQLSYHKNAMRFVLGGIKMWFNTCLI